MQKQNLDSNLQRDAKFLYLIQTFSVVAFSAISYSLANYFVMEFDYSESFAAQLTATYISINFIIHLFAGCLINRTFRANDLLTLSIVLSIIGCFIMANSQSSTIHFTYGLSIQAISSGLATTCINCILNKNSNQKNTTQYKAKFFIINYSYMNIGFIIGLAISGYYQVHNTSSILFNICNIFNLIALLLTTRYNYHNLKRQIKNLNYRAVSILLFIIPIIHYIIKKAYLSNQYILLSLLTAMLYIVYRYKHTIHKNTNDNFQKLILLMISGLSFWSIYNLTPTTLMFFVKHHINTNIFNINIAPQWFEIINSLIIISLTPILISKSKLLLSKIKNFQKIFAIAVGLASLAIIILTIGAKITPIETKIAPIWIITKITLESIGEALLAPIGLLFITKLTFKRWHNIAIGTWLMINGAAASLSGLFVKITTYTHISNHFSLSSYYHTLFLAICIGSVCCFTLLISYYSEND